MNTCLGNKYASFMDTILVDKQVEQAIKLGELINVDLIELSMLIKF